MYRTARRMIALSMSLTSLMPILSLAVMSQVRLHSKIIYQQGSSLPALPNWT